MPSSINPQQSVPPGATSKTTLVSSSSGSAGNQVFVGLFPDQLSQLLPLSLGDGINAPISFPGGVFKEEISNSLAYHRYPNRPGARIENTGRNETRYSVRAYFTNSIFPGQNETWQAGLLFNVNGTAAFDQLRILLNSPGDKAFNHPIDGVIKVQVEHWSYELNPNIRDGSIIDMILAETITDETLTLSTQVIGAANTTATSANLSSVLDNQDPSVALPGISIGQFFGQLNNAIAQAASIPNNMVAAVEEDIALPIIAGVGAIVSNLISTPAYQAQNALFLQQQGKQTVLNATSNIANAVVIDQSALKAFQDLVSLNNTSSPNAPVLLQKTSRCLQSLMQYYIRTNSSASSQIIAAIRAYMYSISVLQANAASSNSMSQQQTTAQSFVLPRNMTWSAIATYLNQSVDNILSLNQALVSDLWVPQGTTIYYASIS